MITFDATLLTNYYNARTGVNTPVSGGASGAGVTGSNKTNSPTGTSYAPRTPWGGGPGIMSDSDLVKSVMNGHRFINPDAAKSDVIGASPDYGKLFSLYQGLNALEGLAQKAQNDKVSDLQMAAIRRRFQAGMKEVQSYIQDTQFDHLQLTEGTLTDKLKNEVGVARTNSTYVGPAIHTGSATTSVKAFEGDVKFSLSVKKLGTATPYAINIDLADMGTQTRSMSNVVAFINTKLKAEGLNTKFEVNRTPAVAQTQVVNGKTITLSKGVDSFGLKIKGVSYEDVTLSAPVTADSVYVVQTTGDPEKKTVVKDDAGKTKKDSDGKTVTETGKDVSSQLIKFQADEAGVVADPVSKVGTKFWTEGQEATAELADNIKTVRQTVSGPDGSVFVLADVEGEVNGQSIKGNQDVALIKYDSAGKVVYSRVLGASDEASGYAMAVSDDGKVAIAGSVTGALNISKTETKTYGTGERSTTVTSTTHVGTTGVSDSMSDSFVTVFDAHGIEEWTQRRGAVKEDEATSIAFGDDGSVYVGGRAKSLMAGAAGGAAGGWDGYMMGFTAEGAAKFTVQTGTANSDTTSQIVVDGSTAYAAAIEDGNVIVRSYNLTATPGVDSKGKPITTYGATVTASRNLGGIGGGAISGLALHDGKLYVGGSTGNASLLGGGAAVTKGHSGGQDAFALSLDADLSDLSGDAVAYYGGSGIEKDARVQFSDGKAWIAGNTTGDIAGTTASSTRTGVKDAYLARLDIASGAVEYQTRYTGQDGIVSPSAIAISKGGSSVLDRLGLPQGTIQQKDLTEGANGKLEASSRITGSTSVRTGDQFYMLDSTGARKTITIDASETMESLAKKIVRASGYRLKVDVMKMTGQPLSQLNIQTASKTAKVEFVAGPAGRDALEGLGLAAGIVSADAKKVMDAKASDYLTSQKMMGLNFDASLNLSTEANIKSALDSIQDVMKNVQKAYTYLKYGDPQESDTKKKGNTSGAAPAYLTNQISNYQAALNRLTGGA